MKQLRNPLAIAAAAALLSGIGAVAPASAAPWIASKSIEQSATHAASPNVQLIRDGYYGRRHHRGHFRNGAWIAAPFLALGLGYGLGADGYGYDDYDSGYRGYAYGSGGGYGRCEATFRSFNPNTGNYMGYDGRYHRCPYI
jgi:BA14K-like protein